MEFFSALIWIKQKYNQSLVAYRKIAMFLVFPRVKCREQAMWKRDIEVWPSITIAGAQIRWRKKQGQTKTKRGGEVEKHMQTRKKGRKWGKKGEHEESEDSCRIPWFCRSLQINSEEGHVDWLAETRLRWTPNILIHPHNSVDHPSKNPINCHVSTAKVIGQRLRKL